MGNQKAKTGFIREDFKTFFPIGSYVKTTVCPLKVAILDGGQSLDTILKIDHLRTIHAMFALNWLRHADILKRTYLCQVSDTGSPEPLVLEASLTDSYMGNQKAKEVKSTTVILSCGPVNHSYHRTQVANFLDGH
jgi:hypothetical protein